MALGTLIPLPFTGFDDDGDPVPGGKLYTYEAGTTTPLATYSDSALTAANANPVVLDAAGRATIFAQPASYKLVLKNASDVTLWTRDNVIPYAPFSVDTTISGTAGETLAANSICYLSDGTGGRTAGRWYLTDADTAAYATTPVSIGIAPSQILIGASGSIRIGGRAENLSGLTAGTTYYVSGTAGALTSSAPANARIVGVADSTTSLVLADSTGPVPASRVTAGTFGSGDFTFSGVIKGSAGSPSAPSIILNGDTDSGVYQPSANSVGVASNGALVTQFTLGQTRTVDGSASAPSYSFTSDPNTGFYSFGADAIGIAANGGNIGQLNAVTSTLTSALTVGGNFTVSGSEVEFTNLGSDTGTDLIVNGFGVVHKLSSSRRYKDNEQVWDGNPRVLLSLIPKTFDYKNGAKGVLFFIAEDVAEVAPVFVNTNAEGQPESIRTNALMAALVALVQQQDRRIAALEARLA